MLIVFSYFTAFYKRYASIFCYEFHVNRMDITVILQWLVVGETKDGSKNEVIFVKYNNIK